MHTWIKNSLFSIICLTIVSLTGCAKYAVLVSTIDVTSDDVMYHSECWYDLFLEYETLRENGFDDENIYVLYGAGTDFDTAHAAYNATTQFGHSITDMAVSKANIQSVFNTLSGEVDSNDYLYFWWIGHGGGSGPDSCNLSLSVSHTGETVTDAELVGYINSVSSYDKRSLAIMACHSGGIVDDLNTAGNNTVVLTSSTCAESSYSILSTCDSVVHAEFNYTLPNALREETPCGTAVGSDYNGNGYVSLSEAHQYNGATMTTSTPQMGDPDNIAATTHIKQDSP